MAIENIDDLTALIENDPAAVREALELIKRTIPNYPVAAEALDDDILALYKDASGGTEQLQIATLLLRTIDNNGGVKSLEAGVIADRPSASTAGADAFFLSTDEPVLYRSDGESWEVVLSGYTSFVDSVSDLRSGSWQGDNLYLSGYYGVGTAGGGPLYRDSADTTTADNGGTVFVDADGVRWKRISIYGEGNTSVYEFGAKGDGSTDDTTAITNALQAVHTSNGGPGGTLFFPPGQFMTAGQSLGSNIRIVMSPETVIDGISGGFPNVNDHLLQASSHENVVIEGNNALLRMPKSEFTDGEGRHTLRISGSNNVSVYDLNTEDSGGDGFYIGGTGSQPYSENVLISHCTARNHKRQGMSIVSGRFVTVLGGHYNNTNGTAPESGIDLEPDGPDEYLENINIIGVQTRDNNGAGILIVPGNLDETHPVSINIYGHKSLRDGTTTSLGAMRFVGGSNVRGNITVDGCSSDLSRGSAIKVDFWPASGPRVSISDYYACQFGEDTGNENRSAFSWFMRGSDPVVEQGNFFIDRLVSDPATAGNSVVGVWLNENGTAGTFGKITIRDFYAESGDGRVRSGPGNVSVVYTGDYPIEQGGSGSTVIDDNPGRLIKTTANLNLDLPDASLWGGRVARIQNQGSNNVQIVPASGQNILGYADDTSIVLRNPGDFVELVPFDDTTWAFITSLQGESQTYWT